MRKIKKILLLGITLFSLASCSNNDKPVESEDITVNTSDENKDVRYKIYLKAKESGFAGSYEDWLNSIRGADGKEIEISVQNDYLVWRYKGDNDWNNLLPIKDLIGPEGKPGNDGVSIKSIEKTKTEGLVDTYTITYSDGKTTTFTVTNGTDGVAGESIKGEPGEDGHTPVIIIGENGNWFIDGVDTKIKAQGENGADGVSITKIEKTKTDGLVDTYTITYSDGNTTTFTVTNGAEGESIKGEPGDDGHTPVITIGENGNWFIDGVDTNFKAQGNSGKSAYEIYCEHYPEYKKSEAEWLDDLVNGRLGTKDTYTVSFNTNTELKIEPQEIKRGDKVKKPQTPVKEGYTFKGWFVGDEKWVFSGYSISEDITLEAHWERNIYTITIDTDNGQEVITKEYRFGEHINLDKPIKTNYIFVNWRDSNGVIIDENYVVKDNVSIVAIWSNKVNIIFNTNGGEPLNSQNVYINSIIKDLPVPIKNNCKFEGWYYDNKKIELPFKYEYLHDIELVAHWQSIENQFKIENIQGRWMISDYLGSDNNLIIPTEIEGKEITGIKSGAFSEKSNLLTVVIPSGIEYIGSYSFNKCDNLISLVISDTVNNIEDVAILDCNSLEKIKIDSNNNHYDSRNNCNAIIDSVKDELLIGCKNTIIPNGVIAISNYAFYRCLGLNSIDIPNTVKTINDRCILERKPYTLGAFNGCLNLISVSIPGSIITISKSTFSNCEKLSNVVISEGVKNIKYESFLNCYNIKNLNIPSSVEIIDDYSFKGCSFNKINVASENIFYDSRNNCNAIIKSQDNKLVVGCKNTIIPSNVLSIGKGAFMGCRDIISISISDGIQLIDSNAFSLCTELKTISISKTVNTIYVDSFLECYKLEEIKVDKNNPIYDSRDNCNAIIETSTNKLIFACKNTVFPNDINIIGIFAFNSCKDITDFVIPKSVTTIERGAFAGMNLTSIIIPVGVEIMEAGAFYGCNVLTINCEAPSRPLGWDVNWNLDNIPVTWGYIKRA